MLCQHRRKVRVVGTGWSFKRSEKGERAGKEREGGASAPTLGPGLPVPIVVGCVSSHWSDWIGSFVACERSSCPFCAVWWTSAPFLLDLGRPSRFGLRYPVSPLACSRCLGRQPDLLPWRSLVVDRRSSRRRFWFRRTGTRMLLCVPIDQGVSLILEV